MKGVNAYDTCDFHPDCQGVVPVDVAGFAYLWCPECRVLANLQAVSPKFEDYEKAKKSKPKKLDSGGG